MVRKIAIMALVFFAVLGVSVFAGGAREQASQTVSLRIATNHTNNTPASISLAYLSERVAELTNGEVKIDVYYDAVLGTESEASEQVLGGVLAMTRVSTGHLNQFIPVLDIFSVPYLFRDLDHKWRVLNGPIGDELEKSIEARNLKLLYWVESGARSIYTNSGPVNHPDDVRGTTIRVMGSPMMLETIERLGASPTTTSFAEVYNALQTGVIDGAENSPSSVYTMRHDEVARYYSLNEHMMIPDVLVMNLDRWNSLSAAHKAAIERASEEARQVSIDAWIVQEEEALASISKNMIVNRIENKQPFIDLLAPMHQKADQQFGGLVSRIVQHR